MGFLVDKLKLAIGLFSGGRAWRLESNNFLNYGAFIVSRDKYCLSLCRHR